jgi:hypothetical protein
MTKSPFRHRFVFVAVIGCAVVSVFSVPQLWAETITYKLDDYFADQGNHHLSGTIVTNGAVDRRLTEADILSATFKIDDAEYTVTSYNIGAGHDWPGPWATSDHLFATADCSFQMLAWQGSALLGWVEWQNVPSWDSQVCLGNAGNYVGSPSWYTRNPSELIAADWAIATVVPEPSTITLLLMALIGLGIIRRPGVRLDRN